MKAWLDAEHDELTERTTKLFKTLHADEIHFDQIATRTLRLWWD